VKNFQKLSIRGIFMREIDCTHRKTLKTLIGNLKKTFFENFSPKKRKSTVFYVAHPVLRNDFCEF
jgi:hypothetical protein